MAYYNEIKTTQNIFLERAKLQVYLVTFIYLTNIHYYSL